MKTQLRFIETRHNGQTKTWTAQDWDEAAIRSTQRADGQCAMRREWPSVEAMFKENCADAYDRRMFLDVYPELERIPEGTPIVEYMDEPNEVRWVAASDAPTWPEIVRHWVGHDLKSLEVVEEEVNA